MISVRWQMGDIPLLHSHCLCLKQTHKGEIVMPDKSYRRWFVRTSFSMLVFSPVEGEQRVQVADKPTLRSLLLVWSKISVLAFGGGSSTLLLMRREFVERYGWLTDDEYARFWGFGQLSPGTNLIAMVILMGRYLGGGAGIVV